MQNQKPRTPQELEDFARTLLHDRFPHQNSEIVRVSRELVRKRLAPIFDTPIENTVGFPETWLQTRDKDPNEVVELAVEWIEGQRKGNNANNRESIDASIGTAIEGFEILNIVNNHTIHKGQLHKITEKSEWLPIKLNPYRANKIIERIRTGEPLKSAILQVYLTRTQKADGWHTFEQTTTSESTTQLAQMCSGSGWCIENETEAQAYLDEYTLHIYLEDNQAKLAVVTTPRKIKECRGLGPKQTITEPLLQNILDQFLEKQPETFRYKNKLKQHLTEILHYKKTKRIKKGLRRTFDQDGNPLTTLREWTPSKEYYDIIKDAYVRQPIQGKGKTLTTCFFAQGGGTIRIPYEKIQGGIWCPKAKHIIAPNLTSCEQITGGQLTKLHAPKLTKVGYWETPELEEWETSMNRKIGKIMQARKF